MDMKLFLQQELGRDQDLAVEPDAVDEKPQLETSSSSSNNPFNLAQTPKDAEILYSRRQPCGPSYSNASNWSMSSWDGTPTHSQQASLSSHEADFSTLPSGWSVGKTEEGRIYFINESQKTTTWLDPRTAKPHPGLSTQPGQMSANWNTCYDLPEGWEMVFTKDKKPYFINHFERRTTWEDPRDTYSSPSPRYSHSQYNSEDSVTMARMQRLGLGKHAGSSGDLDAGYHSNTSSSTYSNPTKLSKGQTMKRTSSSSLHMKSYSMPAQSDTFHHVSMDNPYLQASPPIRSSVTDLIDINRTLEFEDIMSNAPLGDEVDAISSGTNINTSNNFTNHTPNNNTNGTNLSSDKKDGDPLSLTPSLSEWVMQEPVSLDDGFGFIDQYPDPFDLC